MCCFHAAWDATEPPGQRARENSGGSGGDMDLWHGIPLATSPHTSSCQRLTCPALAGLLTASIDQVPRSNFRRNDVLSLSLPLFIFPCYYSFLSSIDPTASSSSVCVCRMRSFLGLFIEASATKGEWLAALSAVQAAGIPISQCPQASPPGVTTSGLPQCSPAPLTLAGKDVQQLVDVFCRAGHADLAMTTACLPAQHVVLLASSPSPPPEVGGAERQHAEYSQISDGTAYVEAQRCCLKRCLNVPQTAADHAGTAPHAVSQGNTVQGMARASVDVLAAWASQNRLSSYEVQLVQNYIAFLKANVPAFLSDKEMKGALDALQHAVQLPPSTESLAPPATAEQVAKSKTTRTTTTAAMHTSSDAASRRDDPRTSPASQDAVIMQRLRASHDGPKGHDSWRQALTLARSLRHPSEDAVCLVLPCLVRQGRAKDVLAYLNEVLDLEKRGSAAAVPKGKRGSPRDRLTPTPRLLKAITEAALGLHSLALCEWVLSSPVLTSALAPSSAVPLVLTLQRLGRQDLALAWWSRLPPPPPPTPYSPRAEATTVSARQTHGHDPHHRRRAPLQGHLKLCNYIAICYLSSLHPPRRPHRHAAQHARTNAPHVSSLETASVGSRGDGQPAWEAALSFLSRAKERDPALWTLFSLRLLRMAKAWQPALAMVQSELLGPFKDADAKVERDLLPSRPRPADGGNRSPQPQEKANGGEKASTAASQKREQWCNAPRTAGEVLRLFTSETPQQWIPEAALRPVQGEVARVVEEEVLDRQGRHQPPFHGYGKTGTRGRGRNTRRSTSASSGSRKRL